MGHDVLDVFDPPPTEPPLPRAVLLDLIHQSDVAAIPHSNVKVQREWFVRRIYTCTRCGHQTRTVGWGLPGDAACFRRLRVGRSRVPCGGRLTMSYEAGTP